MESSQPLTRTPVSKPSVLINLLHALCAIILGNVAYFFLAHFLPLARHRPFQLDLGLLIDFWFCVVAYGLIRTARRWK
jgi:capsular polysaccharide biosynthesis protein